MKATLGWLKSSGAEFGAGTGYTGCVHLSNYTLEYREWGDGPPLVLIPGLAGGMELLGPLARFLSRHFRVISYQLRGEDNCFALRKPFGLEDLVTDLKEFMECLCLECPNLLGISFGGILALEFAVRYPYSLNRLVVQGVGSGFEPGILEQVAGTVLSRFPLPSDNPFINQFFNLLFGCRQKKDALFQFVTSQCWKTDQSVMAHRFRLVEEFNIVPRLERVKAPTLILAGDRDVLLTQNNLARLAQGIQRSRLERLPKCGHLAFVTHPHLLGEKIYRFMFT